LHVRLRVELTERSKVVGYTRVSHVGGRGKASGSFLSPELQRGKIASVASREGLDVVEILEELDASGGDRSRPLWNEAIAMVERGDVGGIVVWNLSRFSRSVKDALTALERIEKAGGRLYSATEQLGDDPAGRMLRNILLAVAENERERAREGFRAATLSALDRGIFVGGTIPVGYRRNAERQLEVNPDKAPIVQGLFARRAQGMSWARRPGHSSGVSVSSHSRGEIT
jgi:DNA invertase Pin-like site-specific DNA recombinase